MANIIDMEKENEQVNQAENELQNFRTLIADGTSDIITNFIAPRFYASSSTGLELLSKVSIEEREKSFQSLKNWYSKYEEGDIGSGSHNLRLLRETIKDSLGTRRKFLENSEATKKFINNIHGGELSEEEWNIYSENLEKEIIQLEDMYAATTMTTDKFLSDAGWIRRNIGERTYNVIADVQDVTDVDDIASAIRIVAAVASVATGGGSLLTVLKTEGAIGTVEGAVDTLRDYSKGEDVGLIDWAENSAINTGLNLVGAGLGQLVGYGFRKGASLLFKKNASEISTTVAKSLQELEEPLADVSKLEIETGYYTKNFKSPIKGTIPKGGTSLDAAESWVDQQLKETGKGSKLSIVKGNRDGQLISEAFNGPFTENIMIKSDYGLTTPNERGIITEAIVEYANKNNIKLTPEEALKIRNLPEVTKNIEIKKVTLQERLFNDVRDSALNQSRELQNFLEKYPTVEPKQVIGTNSNMVINFVQNINRTFKEATEEVSNHINTNIQGLGGSLGIRSYADFYEFSVNNGIDINKAMYTGKLNKEMPDAYKATFQYMKKLYDELYVKIRPNEIFTADSEFSAILRKYNIAPLSILEENTAIPFTDQITRYNIRKDIDVNKVLEPYTNWLSGKVDDAIDEIDLTKIKGDSKEVRKMLKDSINLSGKKLNERIKDIMPQLEGTGITEKELKSTISQVRKNYKMDLEDFNYIKRTINEDISINTKRQNKIWGYINKKFFLENEDIFMVTEAGTTWGKRWGTFNEVSANWTDSDRTLYNELNNKFKIAAGTTDVNAEIKFNGTNINGKIYDSRTTFIDKAYNSSRPKVKWNELTYEQKIKAANDMSNNLVKENLGKMGDLIQEKTGVTNFQETIMYYAKKYEIDNINIVTVKEAESIASVSTQGNKFTITVVDPEGLAKLNISNNEAIGIARHEIEHILETMNTGKMQDISWFDKTFRNVPGIEGTEIANKILLDEKVTLREMIGEYYGKHFYNYQNDNFETSYLGAKLRDWYNNLSDYDKLLGVFEFVRNSRATSTEKTDFKTFWQYGLEKVGATGNDIPQDFLIKSFNSQSGLEDFLFFAANNTKQKNAKAFNSMYQRAKGIMVNNQVGYSPRQLLAGLDASKIINRANERGLQNSFTTTMGENIGHLRTALRTNFAFKSVAEQQFSNTNLAINAFSAMLVGGRAQKDAISTSALVFSNYWTNGQHIKAMMELTKDLPTASKHMARSWSSNVAGNLVYNINTFMKYVLNDLMGFHYEGRALAHAGDWLHNVGFIGNPKLNNKQIQQFVTDTMTMQQMMGGVDHTGKGAAFKMLNQSMTGLRNDDLLSVLTAQKHANFEFAGILTKNSFGELTPIQKKMFQFSGYSQEEFPLFLKEANKMMNEIPDLGNIPLNYSRMKNTIRAGINEFDTLGRIKLGTNTGFNSFEYMQATTKGLAIDLIERLGKGSYNGVYTSVNHGSSKEVIQNIAGYAILGTMAGAAISGLGYLGTSIVNREKTIAAMYEDITSFPNIVRGKIRGKTIFELAISSGEGLLNLSSEALPISSFNLGAPVSLASVSLGKEVYRSGKKVIKSEDGAYLEIANKIGGAIYGASIRKLISELVIGGKTEKQAYNYLNTGRGKNALKKEFQNNYHKYYVPTMKGVADSMKRDVNYDKMIWEATNPNANSRNSGQYQRRGY